MRKNPTCKIVLLVLKLNEALYDNFDLDVTTNKDYII